MRVAWFLVTTVAIFAGDWPQWRGPNRDGIAPGAPPSNLPEKLTRKWQIAIGEGHSSPISAAGRIFAISREGSNEVVRAVDPASGKVLWQQSYAAPYSVNPAATSHGPGTKSTPVYSSGKLCTFGISGVLSCFDAASGRVLWRHDFKDQYKNTSPDFGTAMSPVIDGGLLMAHTGGDGNGALTAFDLNTGAAKWKWTGDGPAYSSPIIVEIGAVRQVVTQSQRNIIGVAEASGELLWKIPYRTNFEQNSVTPVFYNGMLILSGLDNGVMGLRVIKDAKGFRTERVWDNPQATMYMSTGVISGDLLYGFGNRNKGQFVCLDARTGQTLWSSPPRQGENAAIVRQGDTLFLLKNDAELVVARANAKSFEPQRTYTVADSPTWAHPVILDNGIIIKDKNSLALWTWR